MKKIFAVIMLALMMAFTGTAVRQVFAKKAVPVAPFPTKDPQGAEENWPGYRLISVDIKSHKVI